MKLGSINLSRFDNKRGFCPTKISTPCMVFWAGESGLFVSYEDKQHLQGGPLLVLSGVITPKND